MNGGHAQVLSLQPSNHCRFRQRHKPLTQRGSKVPLTWGAVGMYSRLQLRNPQPSLVCGSDAYGMRGNLRHPCRYHQRYKALPQRVSLKPLTRRAGLMSSRQRLRQEKKPRTNSVSGRDASGVRVNPKNRRSVPSPLQAPDSTWLTSATDTKCQFDDFPPAATVAKKSRRPAACVLRRPSFVRDTEQCRSVQSTLEASSSTYVGTSTDWKSGRGEFPSVIREGNKAQYKHLEWKKHPQVYQHDIAAPSVLRASSHHVTVAQQKKLAWPPQKL